MYHYLGKTPEAFSETQPESLNIIHNAGLCLVSVSYTHLDVYKRQGLLEDIVIVPAGLPYLSTKADKAVLDYTDMIALETHIAMLKNVADGTVQSYIKSGTAQSGARPLLPV